MSSLTTHSAIALPLATTRRPNTLHHTLLALAIVFLPTTAAALFAFLGR